MSVNMTYFFFRYPRRNCKPWLLEQIIGVQHTWGSEVLIQSEAVEVAAKPE